MKLISITLALSGFLSAASIASVQADGVVAAEGEKSWGYKENDPSMYGPSQWGKQYSTCAGKRQSPINIPAQASLTKGTAKTPLTFAGSCSNYKLSRHEDAYKGEVQGGSCSVTANGKAYPMVQFHIHAPSEHTLNGKVYDGETHFVHQHADGNIAVVGVFLEKKANVKTDPFIAGVINSLGNTTATASPVVNLGAYSKLLTAAASKGREFNYPGSLTTPVCSEIVDWWVMQQPVQVSTADFDKFMGYMKTLPATDGGRNARPVQPLNGRAVTYY